MNSNGMGSLRILPLTVEGYQGWDAFAHASADAWFWHTSAWMEFAKALAPQRFVNNLSFSILDGADVCAICPALVEEHEGARSFSYAGGPIPFPAFDNRIATARRAEAIALYVRTLESLAQQYGVSYVSVKVPSVASSYLTGRLPYANPLLRFGYFDLAYLTQIVDLREPEEVLWAAIRKGHKADIKRAARSCAVNIWDAATITPDVFRAYQALHGKDAGRVTRSQDTFDQMLAWVRQGHAVLVETAFEGRAMAFALIMRFGSGAYYGSACKDPDLAAIPGSHLGQWEAIRWLKARGMQFYDLGIQQFGPLWFDVPADKELTIARFKRGFGGRTVPLVTAEYFFSPERLEQTFQQRLKAYLASRVAESATSEVG